MFTLKQKYRKASHQFIEQEKLDKSVIGIIVSGSLEYGKIDKNSDIDIHVILDPSCNYRVRGNTWIDGIEIEYFKNPPQQIKAYFERENKSPHTAHMLAYGHIAFQNSPIIEELVKTAKSIIKETPPKLKNVELEFEKYFMDDYYKDLEDAMENRDLLGVNLIRQKIINRSIDIFFKMHQQRRGKDKRLADQLASIDINFHQKIQAVLKESWNEPDALEQLRLTTEKLLGGRRSKEWSLRSKLDL